MDIASFLTRIYIKSEGFYIVMMIKSRRFRWTGVHVVAERELNPKLRMEEEEEEEEGIDGQDMLSEQKMDE